MMKPTEINVVLVSATPTEVQVLSLPVVQFPMPLLHM